MFSAAQKRFCANGRSTEDRHVAVQFGGFAVETDVLQGADRSVHRREYADDDRFVFVLRQRYGLQVLIDYFEKRSPVSGGEVFAHERHGFAPERDFPIIHNFKI